jgi:hypothetical protein
MTMGLTKEQIAADLVWRYVEQIRARGAEDPPAAFTRAELLQLVEALETAGRLPEVLAVPEDGVCRDAVRERLQHAISTVGADGPAPAPGAMRARSGWLADRLVPAWQLRGAVTALAALAVALGTVNAWHRPAAAAPGIVRNVQPLRESEVHALMPRMVRNELTAQQEKNMMWHMLVCPGCFRHYEQLKHPMQNVRELREEFTRLVSR